jgi:hypothetical protein
MDADSVVRRRPDRPGSAPSPIGARPGPGRWPWPAERDLLSWPGAASYLAPIWSLGYGLLALSWALGAAGYPFSDGRPEAGLSSSAAWRRESAHGPRHASLIGVGGRLTASGTCGRGLGRRLAMGLGRSWP